MPPQCPGCLERDARIAQLEQQVADLTEQRRRLTERLRDVESRLGQNASNASIPPSANPPQAPPPIRKQPTGRKPGGQPGHTAHLRSSLDRIAALSGFHHPEYLSFSFKRSTGQTPGGFRRQASTSHNRLRPVP